MVFASVVGAGTYSPTTFWGNSAKNFGKYVRLMLWSLPVLALFYCIQFVVPLTVRVIWGNDPYQYVTWWGSWIRTGLGYIGLLLYLIVFDYARIYIVLTDEKRMPKALWASLIFAYENFFTTFGISFTLFLTG